MLDLADIKGQEAQTALESPPPWAQSPDGRSAGAGQSMLAARLPSILPALSRRSSSKFP